MLPVQVPIRQPGRASAWRPSWRLLAGIWMALQLAIVAGLPAVDAAIEHREVVAHWEDASDKRCPPQHGDAECLLFQTISGGAARALVESMVVADLEQGDAGRPVEADRVQRAVATARLRTRGPPAT